jgi:hypothetical protein
MMMYLGACGAWGINFLGSHGRDALVDISFFPESISIYLSLNVPSNNNCERRSGGGSTVGRLEPPPLFPFVVALL